MTETRKGHIHRVVESLGMGYISDPINDQLWSFRFSQIAGYSGQYADEIGLAAPVPVTFTLQDGTLNRVIFDFSLDKSLTASTSN